MYLPTRCPTRVVVCTSPLPYVCLSRYIILHSFVHPPAIHTYMYIVRYNPAQVHLRLHPSCSSACGTASDLAPGQLDPPVIWTVERCRRDNGTQKKKRDDSRPVPRPVCPFSVEPCRAVPFHATPSRRPRMSKWAGTRARGSPASYCSQAAAMSSLGSTFPSSPLDKANPRHVFYF